MFSTNAKLNNNNNYFTSIYYFIFLLLLSIGCSNAMATAIITTGNPSSCFFFSSGNTLTIGKTASNSNPQTIYYSGSGSSPAVLIINPTSTTPKINKIIFSGNVYGTSTGSSNFKNTAVEINNTNNMYIKYGIEVNSGCSIKGKIAIEIKDKLTANFINRGTISGSSYAFHDSTNSAQNYEIHNHAGATIEGEISTTAPKIENSGVVTCSPP